MAFLLWCGGLIQNLKKHKKTHQIKKQTFTYYQFLLSTVQWACRGCQKLVELALLILMLSSKSSFTSAALISWNIHQKKEKLLCPKVFKYWQRLDFMWKCELRVWLVAFTIMSPCTVHTDPNWLILSRKYKILYSYILRCIYVICSPIGLLEQKQTLVMNNCHFMKVRSLLQPQLKRTLYY